MNVGANYLDARADPAQHAAELPPHDRFVAHEKRWETASDYRYTLGGSIDYTGSFDRIKSDKDIDEGVSGRPLERYKASYNSLSAALNFSAAAKEQSAFFPQFRPLGLRRCGLRHHRPLEIHDRQRQRTDPHGAGGGSATPRSCLRATRPPCAWRASRSTPSPRRWRSSRRTPVRRAARCARAPSGRWPRTTAADCSTT